MSAFIVVVDLDIGAEALSAFLPLMRQNAAASLRDEPGCRQFDVCHDPAAPTSLLLYEVYDDEAAFAAHLASAHYLAFDAATGAMIRSKAVRKLLRSE
jgi:autoinducer 2-degrading protein